MLLKNSISFLWFAAAVHGPHRLARAVGALCLVAAVTANSNASHAAPRHDLTEFCLILQQNASEMGDDVTTETLARKAGASFGWTFSHVSTRHSGAIRRLRFVYHVGQTAETLEIDFPLVGNALHSLRVTSATDDRSQRLFVLGPDCALHETRGIDYGPNGTVMAITVNSADGRSRIMEVNPPPVPRPGQNLVRSVPVIGHIDSGIDYRRPDVIDHLRFAPDGTLAAMDAWDGDGLPYDAHFGASPFFPQRHGTFVFDALHQIGIDFILLPARYPRPDMRRMNSIVHWLAQQGADIVMLPLGSRHPNDWAAFTKAAADYPQILFIISAGNDGKDIDILPVYPAINKLENALTVTSTLSDGRIAAGSNFGRGVDIGLPAENLTLAGPDGIIRKQSGSSFAVPKLAAYAACIQISEPSKSLNGAALARRLTQRLPLWRDPTEYGYFLSDQQITSTCQSRPEPQPRN
jgi:hypothetical protein